MSWHVALPHKKIAKSIGANGYCLAMPTLTDSFSRGQQHFNVLFKWLLSAATTIGMATIASIA
jgi:hypothetical protein